ncbi:hypothetical protein [Elioraea tepidiphila]|uniref:hypothetical protein n=1 Tax=Elioraea tepidiphila TaxID=457934 RepID=UPI002FD9713C
MRTSGLRASIYAAFCGAHGVLGYGSTIEDGDMARLRTHRVTLNFTQAEWEAVRRRTAESGLSLQEFGRGVMLGALDAGSPKIDAPALADALFPVLDALMREQAEMLRAAAGQTMRDEMRLLAQQLQERFLPRVVSAAGGRLTE